MLITNLLLGAILFVLIGIGSEIQKLNRKER